MRDKDKGFKELTFTNGHSEIMFDILKSGQVIALYTYAGNKAEVYVESKDDFVNLAENWEPEANPAFVHCPKKKISSVVKKLLLSSEYSFGTVETSDDVDRIEAMCRRYSLPNDVAPYFS